MKIKTQFIITMALFFSLLVIIVVALFLTSRQVEQIKQQEQIARQIERDARELSYLSNDYLLYRESQQHARWQTKFAALAKDIAELQPDRPELQAIVKDIKSNQQRLQEVFSSVVTLQESAVLTQDSAAEMEFLRVSWSRMEVQNQTMIFDAVLLADKLKDQQDQAKTWSFYSLIGLLVVFAFYFANNSWFISRNLLRSIDELSNGTRVIGSGNLDFKISEQRKDEIGELSRAFNQMTANLKQVTASKADLEKEIVERQRAEEAVRASEHRTREVLESISDGFWAVDAQWRFTYLNQRAAQNLGYAPNDLVGKSIWQTFPGLANTPHDHYYRQVMAERLPYHFEIEGVPSQSVYSISVYPSGDGISVYWQDITQRKHAEAALAASEERFATTLSSIGDAVIATDTARKITFMNRVAETLTGWALADCLGKTEQAVLHIIDERTHEQVASPIAQVLEQGTIIGLANHSILVKQDGTHVPIDDSAAPIHDRHGNITGVVLVFRDITERKRAEQALRDREQELSAIYQYAPSIMLLVDGERHVFKFNKMAEQFTGATAATLLGRRGGEALGCVHSSEDPRGCGFSAHCQHCIMRRTIQDTVETGRNYNQVEVDLTLEVNGQAHDMTFLVSTTQLLIHQEARVLLMLQDITQRKRAEAEIKRHVDELNIANDELLRFNKAMEGRELRMIELKTEVNQLLAQAGIPARYPLDFEIESN